MSTYRAIREMIRHSADYVVVNDGQTTYPVLRTDLLADDSAEHVREMDGDEYAEWCQAVPADFRVYGADDHRLATLCELMIEAGAEEWRVA